MDTKATRKVVVNSLELITRAQAHNICYIDSEIMSKDRKAFVDANAETWYVVCNTWLHLIEDSSKRTRILAQEYILKNGLLALIKDGDRLADAIMHDRYDPLCDNHVWLYLLQDLADSVDAERVALSILRFAKRISPARADIVNERSISDFLQVNEANKKMFLKRDTSYVPTLWSVNGKKLSIKDIQDHYVVDRDLYNYSYLWHDVLTEYKKLCPWYQKGFKCDSAFEQKILDLGEFSNGSTYEHARTLKEKLMCFGLHYDNLGHPMYPIGDLRRKQMYSDSFGNHEAYFSFTSKGVKVETDIPDACRVTAVPKSFKTARIIAQEQTWRAYFMQGLRKYWVDFIRSSGEKEFLDVEDQSPNQDWCWQASWDDSYTTVDSSHASDSISMTLGQELNRPIEKLYQKYASKWLCIEGKFVRSHIYLTSGAPCTFINESAIFLAIARAATHYVQVFYEDDTLREPRTFGDDVLIDVRAADLFCELMAQLGFTINKDKTFGLGSSYRESCGVEYRNGYPLHTVKWPRNCFRTLRPGMASAEEVTSLISLQHHLFDVSWNASRFLIEYVRELVPIMTSSKPFTEADDLWEELPDWKATDAPMGHFENGKLIYDHARWAQTQLGRRIQRAVSTPVPELREVHTTCVSVYDPVKSRDADVEMYRYVRFLKEGPVYSSDLDKLLGVTENPARAAELVRPSLKWQPAAR